MLRALSTGRKLLIVFVAVATWLVFSEIVENWWWGKTVTGNYAVGTGGLFAQQFLAAVPQFIFFLAAGWCIYSLVGGNHGILLTIAFAAIALLLNATRWTLGPPDLEALILSLSHFVLPFFFLALGGAFLARAFKQRRGQDGQTET